MTPRRILGLGWVLAFLYAFPGYMSFDSVAQLQQARWGYFRDDHPPAMAALWQAVEVFVTGPVGMLILQLTAFLVGTYLLFKTKLTPRAAAICAVLVLLFPPVLNTMSVIWKDSQMAAYLVLGTAFLLSPRRGVRLWGLAFLALATAMRHNALAHTLPLVGLLFVWNPDYRWWKRYAIGFVAWVVITMAARVVTTGLADEQTHMWHRSLALLDIVGTLRYAEDIPDDVLRKDLAGMPLQVDHDIQATARKTVNADVPPTQKLWDATYAVTKIPATESEREATTRAWNAIVPKHPAAYARYRWEVFSQLTQLDGTPPGSPIYFWFTDVQAPFESRDRIDHIAHPSGLQGQVHEVMFWLGDTMLFYVSLYLILALVLLPFALRARDRLSITLILSALASEAGLFIIAPTVDVRYSFWLVLATVDALVLLVAIRTQSARPTAR